MMRAVAVLLFGVGLLIAGGVRADVERWEVVRSESTITMRVGSPLGARSGRFERWTGDIRFDPAAPASASVGIEVEASSLRMDDAALTRTALGPAFLDSAAHPRIAFRLRSLEGGSGDRFTARADITLRGVTRPVSFPVTLRTDGRTAQMTGGFSLDRAAFGIGTRGPWNGLIGRQVRVDVVLATRPAG
jgi:polyisoprenoid-binding protein YceI